MKFGAFLEYLEQQHPGRFDRIASGHYAKVIRGADAQPGAAAAGMRAGAAADAERGAAAGGARRGAAAGVEAGADAGAAAATGVGPGAAAADAAAVAGFMSDREEGALADRRNSHASASTSSSSSSDGSRSSSSSIGGSSSSSVQEVPVLLGMTPDALKDQTYFLAHLSPQQLARAMFPLGGFTKPQVRLTGMLLHHTYRW